MNRRGGPPVRAVAVLPEPIGRRKCSAKDGRYSQGAEALIKFAFAVDRPLFLFGSILCASHQLSDLNKPLNKPWQRGAAERWVQGKREFGIAMLQRIPHFRSGSISTDSTSFSCQPHFRFASDNGLEPGAQPTPITGCGR
jgi:hypothetical protein